MMGYLRYTSASGKTMELDGPVVYVGTAAGLRSRAWQYELGFRELYSARRGAREVELEIAAPYAQADAFRRLTEADMAAQMPGTFAVGEWRQAAYIAASEPQIIGGGDVLSTLAVLLMEGYWWRLEEIDFHIPSGGGLGGHLDYPYDLPTDFGKMPDRDSVESSTLTPSNIRLTIYGPAVNPYVIIGANRYQVDVTVPSGSRLVVDGKAATIETVSSSGIVADRFADGVRGTGLGGGAYIFEPLQPGPQTVSWDGSFEFTLGWYEEEGSPPWKPLD